MNGYLMQPPGACYFFAAANGLLQLPLGARMIRDRIQAVQGGFRVTFDKGWQCEVSDAEIETYMAALEREPIPNPPWVGPLEVAYNKYLEAYPPKGMGCRYFNTSDGKYLPVRTIGGYSHEVLEAFASMDPIFCWVPSQNPTDIHDTSDDSSPWWDLELMKRTVTRLKDDLAKGEVILCAGTRRSCSDGDFLVSEHGYWVRTIESMDGEDALRLVDLRAHCQAERLLKLSELVPCLAYLDGARFRSEC